MGPAAHCVTTYPGSPGPAEYLRRLDAMIAAAVGVNTVKYKFNQAQKVAYGFPSSIPPTTTVFHRGSIFDLLLYMTRVSHE